MVITKTPFRMSFFGGGTDYSGFYNQYGGAVLSCTIDKYCYVNVRKLPAYFNYKNQVVYSKIENVVDPSELEHPMVRNCMKLLEMDGLRIAYDADLPARTGLGTSSSFAVGLLSALHTLRGEMVDNLQLAQEAIYVERTMCQESGGVQDQIAAAYGGLNRIIFQKTGFSVEPLPVSKERIQMLSDRLLLFFTGQSRFSGKVSAAQEKATPNKTEELLAMKDLVEKGCRILCSQNDLCDFGHLLHESWEIKRGLTAHISNNDIDAAYAHALKSGALGGKLLGAGGGGFLLFYVEPERQAAFLEAMKSLLYVPFSFDAEGTKTIYFRGDMV